MLKCEKCGLPKTDNRNVALRQAVCVCMTEEERKDQERQIDTEQHCPGGLAECEYYDRRKNSVSVSPKHAYSLAELVKWFKKMIETGNIPDQEGCGDVWTIGYCDALLEDLGAAYKATIEVEGELNLSDVKKAAGKAKEFFQNNKGPGAGVEAVLNAKAILEDLGQ